MHTFAQWTVWIYIVLLLTGGLIGFWKGKSQASLVASAVFGALLILTMIPKVLDAGFARQLRIILLTALLVVFAIRLAKTKKFMPSGMMLVVTAVVLAI